MITGLERRTDTVFGGLVQTANFSPARADRAKGLEFDDVVILNGGWDNPSDTEDADAPRRLFYVALTRACRSLAVTTQGAHAFIPAKGYSIFRREAASPDLHALPPERFYIPPGLGQIFIDWAGRLPAHDRCLKAITQAQVGVPVTLAQIHKRWFVTDGQGRRCALTGLFRRGDGLSLLRSEQS